MQVLRDLDEGQFGPPDDYDGASVIPLFLVAEIQIELAEIATSTPPPRALDRLSLSSSSFSFSTPTSDCPRDPRLASVSTTC